MLKKRLIPILLLDNDRVWKSKQFAAHRDVGSPKTAAKVYESQEADELILLNINKEEDSFSTLLQYTNIISQECCMPLSVGGGIQTFQQVQDLFTHGADKVILNTINYSDLSVLQKTSNFYGRQAAISAIDVRFDVKENAYKLFSHAGQALQSSTLLEHVRQCEQHGTGEFFIQSLDCDGMMQGLDNRLGEIVTESTRKPVVLAGGIGSYTHIEEALKSSKISGVACASIFHFTDSNPLRANAHLANAGITVKKV